MTTEITVTPLDIQQKQFPLGFRGYDRGAVDAFLNAVREELEALLHEVTDLRDFQQTHDQRVRDLQDKEETVKNTMLMTQKLVEELKESARKEAALIVREGEVRCGELIAKAQQEKVRLEADVQELKRRKHHFLQDVKKVIQMHLEMVQFEEGGNAAKKPGAG